MSDLVFKMPGNTRVFSCVHVSEANQPILYVSHDGDGDWQFLCGGIHEDTKPTLLCLEHVLEQDPTLNELANLRCNHTAERTEVGADWVIVDEGEAKLKADIEEHGWHLVGVRADDEGPEFVYSVGMKETLAHPEIIMFGLPLDLLFKLVNDLGAMIRAGRTFANDDQIEDLISAGHCVMRAVTDKNRVEHLRYASWYYGERGFEALQCFWPSKTGLFPWDQDAHEDYVALQPDLSKPA